MVFTCGKFPIICYGWKIGRYLDPIFFGDYPSSVKRIVGSRLPRFTREESECIKGSFDFIGMNHYVTLYVMDNSTWVPPPASEDPGQQLPDSPQVPDAFAVTAGMIIFNPH